MMCNIGCRFDLIFLIVASSLVYPTDSFTERLADQAESLLTSPDRLHHFARDNRIQVHQTYSGNKHRVPSTDSRHVAAGVHSAFASKVSSSSPVTAKLNAYGTILYIGTPRDYEFYIAARVLLQSLARLRVTADLVLIASLDVPKNWADRFEIEGVRVVRVPNLPNPFKDQPDFDNRFKYSLNKVYAWKLIEYERVVMLDVDNVFMRNTDELFLCGQFCAVFIDLVFFILESLFSSHLMRSSRRCTIIYRPETSTVSMVLIKAS